MLEVRGETLFVAILFSPRWKVTLSNMFKGEALMKKHAVNPEAHMLCPGCSNILNTATDEDLDKTPTGSNTWIWHREKCSSCGLSLSGWEEFALVILSTPVHMSVLEEWDALLLEELSFKDELMN